MTSRFKERIEEVGDFFLFLGSSLLALRFLWSRKQLFFKQCEIIGYHSLGINLAAGLFMGGVLGFQLYTSLHRFGAEGLIGSTMSVSLFRELGPVMAAMMVTGRAGAAMAAEISSMKLSEQVDALEVMAVDPFQVLVAPRIAAGVLVMPILALVFIGVASYAGCLIACNVMGLQAPVYWEQYFRRLDNVDLLHWWVKSTAFGLLISWVGCFCGFRAFGGARAVGKAAQDTVVITFLLILFCDFLLTSLLPLGFKTLKVMPL